MKSEEDFIITKSNNIIFKISIIKIQVNLHAYKVNLGLFQSKDSFSLNSAIN